MLDQLCLRPAQNSDASFIFNSWLRSHETSPFARFIPKKVYYEFQKDIVQKILDQSLVLIAAANDDSDHILGYLVYSITDEKLYVHYSYVKQVYRQMGIATSMFKRLFDGLGDDQIAIATHATTYYPYLSRKFKMIYNPYLIERFTT
jgi:ribosomal protein S18 acetylase RimI-like enzyme